MTHGDRVARNGGFDDPMCVFCEVLEEFESPTMPPLNYNTCLAASDHFVVLPALGPLVKGHVLVVSKAHMPSLASLGEQAICEFEELAAEVKERYGPLGIDMLEAEHGATASSGGGGCISHAHVNLIPRLGYLYGALNGTLPPVEFSLPLASLAGVNHPYILMKRQDSVKLYDAFAVPSQLIRRVLCKHLGRENWDWAVFPSLSLVDDTIGLWKEG
jgi:diadenosine tetraphosphate (Ap4A) HIT family hydrolase